MFSRLKLKVDNFVRLRIYANEKAYFSSGILLGESYAKSFNKSFAEIINSSKPLDSSEVENIWFPDVPCHIFISHSHKDEDLAIKLAGMLKKEYGLDCFIDSTVWKHENDLFDLLEKKYNFDKDGDPLFDDNISQQNREYCVLLTNCALMKMIDRCDCVLFLETENSVPVQNVTFSPWINSEIMISNLIRTTQKIKIADSFSQGATRPRFKLDFKSFINVTMMDFDNAKKKYGVNNPIAFLNGIYETIDNRNR